MSFAENKNSHLLFTIAVVLGVLLGQTNPGHTPNLSIGPRYSPTRTWAFFLLPGSMWGRVGSQTKQNTQGRPGQDTNAAFTNDVDGLSQYKDKHEQAEKSQLPPPKDVKTVRKSTLLHSAWVIIAIVLTIVLSAVAIYYWVLFYPILCKEERKYDVMQMSAKP